MSKKNLLICFDAFGTLFAPKRPVTEQYAETARALGLRGFTDKDLQVSFKTAYKNESNANPNFGRTNGLNPELWWTNIIKNTFQPIIGPNQQLPPNLVPKLVHRFWSNEGYNLLPGVEELMLRLRNHYRASNGSLIVGVITNSDPRVPDVLTSLGLRVSPLRYESPLTAHANPEHQYDIDFSVMSYDVGHEKPDKRIFEAAEEMLQVTLHAGGVDAEAADWQKVYVGDEYEKDVVGAVNAGWDAVLINAETTEGFHDVRWVDTEPDGNIQDLFRSSKAVGFSALGKLAEWLPLQR